MFLKSIDLLLFISRSIPKASCAPSWGFGKQIVSWAYDTYQLVSILVSFELNMMLGDDVWLEVVGQ